MNDRYKKLIDTMASHYDLYGEMPNMYSDEFQEAVQQKLLKDESGMQYTHFKYLPIFERDYRFPELLQLISLYIKEEGDIDKETKISRKLANLIVDNITLYFRDDIEDDIKRECQKKYGFINNNTVYYGHTDHVET